MWEKVRECVSRWWEHFHGDEAQSLSDLGGFDWYSDVTAEEEQGNTYKQVFMLRGIREEKRGVESECLNEWVSEWANEWVKEWETER